ncbi:MAG: DUF3244 domain-containing protein [Bacteroidales bacterium]|nr:DUF3244 domain-containing protein [Bacteroidales bacterium]
MQNKKLTLLLLWLGLLTPITWCDASGIISSDGYSHIVIKESEVHSEPKGSSIQASIDGHVLTVVFLENLGQVSIEISRVPTGETQIQSTHTPDGVEFYIFSTGNFIVTFTLPNGDEYYGEFSVTD